MRWFALFLVAALVCSWPSLAVVIASGDGSGNVTPNDDDPGLANVGTCGVGTCVYLGNRWVVTARHVGQASVVFPEAGTHSVISGSRKYVPNDPWGLGAVDLALQRLATDPGLPSLEIASVAPPVGADVILIGAGRERGAPYTTSSGATGWLTLGTRSRRWGSNRLTAYSVRFNNLAEGFSNYVLLSLFNPLGQSNSTTWEAAFARGDSGGALFWRVAGVANRWKLAGVIAFYEEIATQAPDTAVYGETLGSTDLSRYRDGILAIVNAPECGNGFDDDGDGDVDYPADAGCSDAADVSE